MGATLSSKTGPGKKLLNLQKKDKKGKNLEVIKPILIKGQDLENLDAVLNFLKRSGVAVGGYKRNYLIRRTRARISRLKLNTYLQYLAHLKKDENEIKELQEALSINVTRFFRNEDTYNIIRDEILPDITDEGAKGNSKNIKIWSAGCAVGAEPYSLAMICKNEKYREFIFQIFASDINKDLVELAENGIYSPQYLAEMSERQAQKFFYKNIEGNYQIKPSIKKIVRFDVKDLTRDKFPYNLNLILCRNVLIYIDRSMQESIIDKFYKSLKVGGILILGRTETLWGKWKGRFSIVSSKHRIYKKIAPVSTDIHR